MQTFALDLEYNVVTKDMMSTEYIYYLRKSIFQNILGAHFKLYNLWESETNHLLRLGKCFKKINRCWSSANLVILIQICD